MSMMASSRILPLALLLSVLSVAQARLPSQTIIRLPSQQHEAAGQAENEVPVVGTRWAVLVAGSKEYYNYRHQADICHAYQILSKGGLKDENIIVFMYDDIANHPENPRPGVIINHPQGGDVYNGVPKDYTGEEVNVNNFLSVLLGNKTALSGGSGKVVDSGPNDHIFVFYSDHGGPGVIGMPTKPYVYANDLVDTLKKKHAAGSYKSLVFYLEACDAGSMFEGILPDDIGVYAITASGADEGSWPTYCPGGYPSIPPEYDTCLGDFFSIAWMEDSDVNNLRTESLEEQYNAVKKRVAIGSHVMQYGSLDLNVEPLFTYIGSNSANDNTTFVEDNSVSSFSRASNQRDADLIYFWQKYRKSTEDSPEKNDARKQLLEIMEHRSHLDNSMELIGNLLFGSSKGPIILKATREAGVPLVDDWSCLKSTVCAFESHCGSLAQYGMKHMLSFANICNTGIHPKEVGKVAAQACISIPTNPWSTRH